MVQNKIKKLTNNQELILAKRYIRIFILRNQTTFILIKFKKISRCNA